MKREPTMKKTILFLLLAWIAIYAGNHLLFKSVPKNSEVETALRSQTDFREARN